MRRYCRIAVMRQFTHHLHDPFVPSGQMMNDNNAGIFSGGARSGVIGLALVAVMAAEFHSLRLQRAIVAHGCTPSMRAEKAAGRTGRPITAGSDTTPPCRSCRGR